MKCVSVMLFVSMLFFGCGEREKECGEDSSAEEEQCDTDSGTSSEPISGGQPVGDANDSEVDLAEFTDPLNIENQEQGGAFLHSWQGSNDGLITENLDLEAGPIGFEVDYTGDDFFDIELQDENGEAVEFIAAEIGTIRLRKYFNIWTAGTHRIVVKSNGEWTIKQFSVGAYETIPAEIQGATSWVSKSMPFEKDAEIVFDAEYIGDAHFSVFLKNATTGRIEKLLFNETGEFNGQTNFIVSETDNYLFEVSADRAWKLKISAP